MAVTINLSAPQNQGPFPVAGGALVSLNVPQNSSTFLQYCTQPQVQSTVYQTWPNGTTSGQIATNVPYRNSLLLVKCLTGTAVLSIGDPDPANELPGVDWWTQNQVASGTTSAVSTNPVVIQQGGTGATSQVGALTNLLPSTTGAQAFAIAYDSTASIAYGWNQYVGWYVTPLTNDSAGLQTAITAQRSTSNWSCVLLRSDVTYNLTSQVQIIMATTGLDKSINIICEGGQATLNYSSLAASTAGLFVRGGAENFLVIEGINFIGNASNHAIEFNCNVNARVRRCHFSTNRWGVWFNNNLTNSFSEMCEIQDSHFEAVCQTAVRYTQSSGTNSFHGTGLRNCVIANDGSFPAIQIDGVSGGSAPTNCVVYGAPLEVHVFATGAPMTLINNDSAQVARFNGWIDSEETFTGSRVNVGKTPGSAATIVFQGTLHSLQDKLRLGDATLSPIASWAQPPASGIGTTDKPTHVQLALTNVSSFPAASRQVILDAQNGWHGIIRFQNTSSNYDCRYEMTFGRDSPNTGFMICHASLLEDNTAGYGTYTQGKIKFDVASDGLVSVNCTNWPDVGVFAFLDGWGYGQQENVRCNFLQVTSNKASQVDSSTFTVAFDLVSSQTLTVGRILQIYNREGFANSAVSTLSFGAGITTILVSSQCVSASVYGFNYAM